MKIKASEAVVGQWYESGAGERLLCVGNQIVEDRVDYATLSRHVRHIHICSSDKHWNLTHLPDCDGWDWKPEPKQPTYRPFKSFVEFIERGGHERWISVGGVYRKPSCLRAKEQFVSIGGGYITLEELFRRCKFIDPLTGETEPCGVRDE